MNDLVARAMRELPDTDKDRYDVAYERGRAQARSIMLFGGMVVGALAGAVATFLFDPARGKARRDELSRQISGRMDDISRTVESRSKDARNRMQGFAVEHGVQQPPAEHAATATTTEPAWVSPEAVPDAAAVEVVVEAEPTAAR